jgi:hypothetical protein
MPDRPNDTHPPSDPASPLNPLRRLDAAGIPEWTSPPRPLPLEPPAVQLPPPPAWPQPAARAPEAVSPPRRSRARTLAIAGLIAGTVSLAAVASGGYLAYQALLGHEDRATAAYAPVDSWAYVAVNTDPTSRAWLDAWNLAGEAGLDDVLARLPEEGFADAGEDPSLWETLVKPAVGREVGVAVWPNPSTRSGQALLGVGEESHVAGIVMIADEAKARDALVELLDDPQDATYRDVAYQVDADGEAAGIVDEALVMASSAAAFEDVVDAHLDGALDAAAAFDAAAGRAADDPLVFAWVDTPAISAAYESLAEDFDQDAGIAAFGDSFGSYAEAGALTVTVKADDDALRVVTLTEGRPASFPTTPAGDHFAAAAPAATVFYLASADLYDTVWRPLLEQLEALEDTGDPSAALAAGILPGVDGLDIEDELLTYLRGAYAVSVNVESDGAAYRGAFHLFSEVDDEAATRAALDDLAAWIEEAGTPVEQTSEGFAVAVEPLAIEASFALADGALHVSGSYAGPDNGGALAADPGYARALAGTPDDATLRGYLAIDRIIDLLPADAWDDMDPDGRAFLEALGPLAWSSAPAGDGTRTEVVLFFD